jgi:hypothetical protein
MRIPVSNRATRIEEFMKWMKENGAEIERIKIAEFPGYGCGIKAEKKFLQGDLLITVPRKVMLTTENVEDSLLGMFVEFCYCYNNKNTAVGIRCADHATPLCPHELAVTSPTSGGWYSSLTD